MILLFGQGTLCQETQVSSFTALLSWGPAWTKSIGFFVGCNGVLLPPKRIMLRTCSATGQTCQSREAVRHAMKGA